MNPRKRRMLKMRVRASKEVKVAPEVPVVEAPKKVAPAAPKKERVVKKATKKSSAKKSS